MLTTGMIIILGICSIIDLRYQKIWAPLIGAAFVFCIFCLCRTGADLPAHLLSGAAAGGVFLWLSAVMGGQIGAADGMFIGISVLSLGYIKGMAFIFMSLLYAFIAALILMVCLRLKKDTRMPFVPFMLAGYLTVLMI